MKNAKILLSALLLAAIIACIVYLLQKHDSRPTPEIVSNPYQIPAENTDPDLDEVIETEENSEEIVNEAEFYSSQYYSFSKPADFTVVDGSNFAGTVYMKNNEAKDPFGLADEEIWITVSPRTEAEYQEWLDSGVSPLETTYVQDGPIHGTKYVNLDSGYYIIEMIVGGGEQTERSREVFTLISSTIK